MQVLRNARGVRGGGGGGVVLVLPNACIYFTR